MNKKLKNLNKHMNSKKRDQLTTMNNTLYSMLLTIVDSGKQNDTLNTLEDEIIKTIGVIEDMNTKPTKDKQIKGEYVVVAMIIIGMILLLRAILIAIA